MALELTAQQRRKEILQLLESAKMPISASTIAKKLGVSRQVIVGDVALLRAADYKIDATPRGYILPKHVENVFTKTIACCHTKEDLKKELYVLADCGVCVQDVTVEHPLYGQISAKLHITSRYDADLFLEKFNRYGAKPLSSLTEGIHLHTVTCADMQKLKTAEAELEKLGILLRK